MGNGVEQAVYDHLFQSQLLSSRVWTQTGDYWTIALPAIQVPALVPEIKAWGGLAFLFLYRFGIMPPRVSPFLIQAVLHGVKLVLDLQFIKDIEPACAYHLGCWLELSPSDELNMERDHKLVSVVIEVLGMDVSRSCEALDIWLWLTLV